jgi:putative Ca2+/H+ antiporter (TMEM165/GDT1 family)
MDFAGLFQPINWHLFVSTFFLIALAELPDKTALATILMASRHHPTGVFLGVAGAFLVQTIVAVVFGSALNLLPHWVVQLLAAVMFLGFAAVSWIHSMKPEEKTSGAPQSKGMPFWKTAGSAFMVIFIAEWGDLTQILTANLAAHYHSAISVGVGATAALWTVAAIAVLSGQGLMRRVPVKRVRQLTGVILVALALVSAVETVRG